MKGPGAGNPQNGEAGCEMEYPKSIVIEQGALCMDGGSIILEGRDPAGEKVSIDLDWSLEAQENGTAELNFNGRAVPKRSPEEEQVLELLRNAVIEPSEDEEEGGERLSEKRLVRGWDIEEFVDAIDGGSVAALSVLVRQVIDKVSSEVYMSGRR